MNDPVVENITSESRLQNEDPPKFENNEDPTTSDRDTEISQNPKENTRKIIASLYVWAFFIIIFISLVIGVINNFSVNDYKDILVTLSGVLSGPLGFIVGYYFKASNE